MSQNNSSIPLDYEDLDFDIVRERWNEYELVDGTSARVRILLTRIARDPRNHRRIHFDTKYHWIIRAPPHLRGLPNIPDRQELQSREKYRMDVNTNNEPWNVYRILHTGQELKIKFVLDEAFKFKDTYDGMGCPHYDITRIIEFTIKDNSDSVGAV